MIYEVLLNKNWEVTCDIFGIIAGIWAVAFIFINLVPDLHKEKKQKQEMRQKLEEKGMLKTDATSKWGDGDATLEKIDEEEND